VSDGGEPLFRRPASYRAAVALPFLGVVLLEATATAYQTGQRPDEALKTWQQLYDTAKTAGFTLAAAEAVHAMADLSSAKKDYDNAISYYALAAQAWTTGGNQQRRIDALSSEAALLFARGQVEKALQIDEEILPLAKVSHDVRREFFSNLAIAEALQDKGNLARTEIALRNAESLVSPDLTVKDVSPSFVVELYVRLADLEEKKSQPLEQLLALEKAMLPAEALGTSPPATSPNMKPMAWLDVQVKEKLAAIHAIDAGEKAFANGDLLAALLYFELVQYFERTDSRWNGKFDEYSSNLGKNVAVQRVLALPFQIITKPDGAKGLENNIARAGPIAQMARLPILTALTNYYMMQQHPEMAVKSATAALPYLKLAENDEPNRWDVELVCELAVAQLLQKDLRFAVQYIGPCLRSAKRLGDPQLLAIAHQSNVWVLEAAGKQAEAEESVRFLQEQKPTDPLLYVTSANLKTEQGDFAGAIMALEHAIQLYEAKKDFSESASTHLLVASSIKSNDEEADRNKRSHLDEALALYKQIDSSEGQVRAYEFLAEYYEGKHDGRKAQELLEAALTLARQAKKNDLEAGALAELGLAYRSASEVAKARDYYQESVEVYHRIGDSADEAFQLRNVALALSDMHEPTEALEAGLQAKSIADASKSWFARYWVRRALAQLYGNQGEYERSITCLQEARSISDLANQPLNSAWAAVELSGYLRTIGMWQESSEEINSAIPVLRQFKDSDDEAVAYVELMGTYGARESEIKDLDKALDYYRMAYGILSKTHPERVALLNLDIAEIYWDRGRFKDAIAKSSEALSYYKGLKDELGQASALLTLAEAESSDGDLQAAAHSLELAKPLVNLVRNFYVTGRLYYGQASLLRKKGQFKEAIEQYQRVIALVEQFKSSTINSGNRRLVSETYSFIYDELIDTYYSLGNADSQYALSSADKALEYTELNKSRVFAHSWGQVFIDGLRRQVPTELQERERTMSAHQTMLQSELQESLAGTAHRTVEQVEEALDSLKREQTRLVQELRQASPAYAEVRYPEPIVLAQLPVRSEELLIEFKMLRDAVLVWMVRGSPQGGKLIAFYKVDRTRQWFQDRIFSFRDAFNTGHPERFDPKVSEELFNSLFPAPFAEHLTTAQSVVFVPDDILFLLPFEMLSPNASKGEYFLLKTGTDYFPSSGAFRLSRAAVHARPAWQEQFIGIADPITSPDDERYVVATILPTPKASEPELTKNDSPTFRGLSVAKIRLRGLGLERLPDTATEVASIASLFPGAASSTEVRTGITATKQQLLQTDLGRFRFVHFATHGILPVEAAIKEPALVLSFEGTNEDDMLLTLSEVFQLKLHADMVVLSACNTGSGRVTRAEGVASLGTAFLAAGASSATVSLWQVADKSTAILMKEFYRNLLKGLPKAASLAAARSTLVSMSPEYKNPFYWAPFVLTGE
jgi:CHAT domain-containing protein